MRFSLRKPKPAKVPVLDPGFRQAQGMPYLDFLSALHEVLAPAWYLEIGTWKGLSLERARCRSIAIDPEFRIAVDVHRHAPELHMFRQTSDAFFASGFLETNGIRIDLAFLDGMHLFEYLLRDLINCERAAAPGAVLAMHDCMPLNANMAERDRKVTSTYAWTGDVWKVLPILRKHRPDLAVSVVDCPPTGLALVSGLDPTSAVLSERYDAIVAEMTPVRLEDYGVERFFAEFPFADGQAAAARAAEEGRAALGLR
jgi:hypothetical protein